MTIGINGYEAVIPRFGYNEKTGLPRRVGSSEYCFQLLLNLNKIDKKNNYIIYLPQKPTADLPKETERWRYKVIGPQAMWTLIGLSLEFLFKRSKPDIFFSPTHYLPLFLPKRSVISILDVSYIRYPNLFKKSDLSKLTNWTKYSVGKSEAIFTISKASKDDIIREYKISENRVFVTYPGIKEISSMEKVKNKYKIKGNYILFVGTLQPRKNIIRLIEAFSKLKKDLQLIIIGKKGWLYEDILAAPGKFNVQEKVMFLDTVTDEELPSFYKNALCFVLPSLYEGFGLPVLEAMKYGCPVVASKVSSLPEAGGDAALYVDPMDTADIAKNLELVIQDSELRSKMIKKGHEQVKKFSWEKTARETLKGLETLVTKS